MADTASRVATRQEEAANALEFLRIAQVIVERLRDGTDRGDPNRRYLSIAITHIEDASLRLNAALTVGLGG